MPDFNSSVLISILMVYNSFMKRQGLPTVKPDTFDGYRGQIIDLIPASERHRYFLRAAHLGSLTLNLLEGKPHINPTDDLLMHIAIQAPYHATAAREHAVTLTRKLTDTYQFNDQALARYEALAGYTPTHFPAIILGIPRVLESLRFAYHPTNLQPVIASPVLFSDIDPDSRAILENLLDVDLTHS